MYMINSLLDILVLCFVNPGPSFIIKFEHVKIQILKFNCFKILIFGQNFDFGQDLRFGNLG